MNKVAVWRFFFGCKKICSLPCILVNVSVGSVHRGLKLVINYRNILRMLTKRDFSLIKKKHPKHHINLFSSFPCTKFSFSFHAHFWTNMSLIKLIPETRRADQVIRRSIWKVGAWIRKRVGICQRIRGASSCPGFLTGSLAKGFLTFRGSLWNSALIQCFNCETRSCLKQVVDP